MGIMPFHVLGIWGRGLLAVALVALGLGLLREWDRNRTWVEEVPAGRESNSTPARADATPLPVREATPAVRRVQHWRFGLNRPTAYLVGGLTVLAISLGGGSFAYPRLLRRPGDDEPNSDRTGEVRRIRRPDGTELQVEFYGPQGAPTVVLTHGWGANSTEWYYAKKELGKRFRLVVWDLPGLGLSTRPADNDWSLEKLAGHLDAVVRESGEEPVILMGHSIGGMTMLTYCRLFHEQLGRRVAGLVLVHTSYTNPVRTTSMSGLYTALQKPVIEPLCHLMIWFAPVVWVMNWLSYLNGSLHRQNHKEAFAGHETRGQLDFTTRFQPKAWPGVLARGMLAMLRYDATATLPTIKLPTLVVAADQDVTTKPEASEYIALHVPEATLVTLSPARHLGVIERHSELAAHVDQFVTSSTPGAATVSPVA